MRVRKWPVVGVVLAILWLFVRGTTLDPTALLGEFLLGLAFGLPIAFLFRRLYAEETNLGRNLRATPYGLLYIGVFLRELLTANVDVAYRVLAPSQPIYPGVIVVPLRVRTDPAITTIANSITLTPGTLTMDYDADRNALYVHAIDGRDPESVVAPIRTWENYALVIFDEELQPGDPVADGAETAAGDPAEAADGVDARGDRVADRPDGGDGDGR